MGCFFVPAYLNKISVYSAGILIMVVIATTAGHEIANLFSKRMKNVRDRTGFAQRYSGKSAIDCATSCQEKSVCETFSFDKKTKTCSLGNASNESTRMYKKKDNMPECSEQKGYLLWVYPETAYCLKYNPTGLTQPNAKQKCNDDGGDLTLIESSLMRTRLRGIYMELVGPTTSVFLWFDGYDIGDKDIFMSRKGGELPWLEWNPGQPESKPGEDCISANWNEYFLLRDAGCQDYQNQFFCQIDLF